jgi:cell division protein ZapD
MEDLQTIKRGIELSLSMVRSSSTPIKETASAGFYQNSIDPESNYQLLRILLPEHAHCFPEISGGRQRFTVRFMELENGNDRPTQVEEDVEFELHCCVL